MAITRARLPISLPWRRGSDAPDAGHGVSTVVETPSLQETASRRSSRRVPERGPDGRFLRRPADSDVHDPSTPVATTRPVVMATSTDAVAQVALMAAQSAPIRPDPAALPTASDTGDVASHGDHDSARRPYETALQPGDQGPVPERLGPQPLRIVLVEDVPQVVEHVRELLRSQSRFKLIHVLSDGGRAAEAIHSLEPDVVLVDSLLQGRTSGASLVTRLRSAGSPVGIVALTVPDHPLKTTIAELADAVVTLPFRTFDLGRGIMEAHAASTARNPAGASRIVAIFSPKGGVGKTTIAYNLAVSLAATGLRTLLVDGCLQFGDVRRLLRADPTAPSICDLPTHSVRGPDLADVVVRHTSGLDILLAPPRPEFADLVTGRDLDQLIGVLRRSYQAIVIDTPSTLSESTLAFLDAADLIFDVLTPDPATVDVTRTIAATFAEIGYPTTKVRYLLNQHDAPGAPPAAVTARALGREPDHKVASDWNLVSASNAQGLPFVLARADAPASADVRRVADGVRALAVTPAAALGAREARRH